MHKQKDNTGVPQKITLGSLKNTRNRKYFIAEIRNKTIALVKGNWNIEYTRTKEHTGH